MIAYHNDPNIKATYLARVANHRAADQLIQGTGWENGKGCAVGCTLEAYDHAAYERELGIPIRLAYLEDSLFELLPAEAAMSWPERFLSAIRPGSDLSGVWALWAVWMLEDPDHGVIRYATGYPDIEAAIRCVAGLWRNGGTAEQFRAAAAAAAAYAAYAAYAAAAYAYAYAAYAADAAAYAARAAAARASWANAACNELIALLEAAC